MQLVQVSPRKAGIVEIVVQAILEMAEQDVFWPAQLASDDSELLDVFGQRASALLHCLYSFLGHQWVLEPASEGERELVEVQQLWCIRVVQVQYRVVQVQSAAMLSRATCTMRILAQSVGMSQLYSSI